QMRRGALEHCVLALLAEQPRYGFELVQRLGEVNGMLASDGTVYTILARLRAADLVSAHWEESPTGPPRKYYQLTAAGERAFSIFVDEWRTFRAAVDTLIARGGKKK